MAREVYVVHYRNLTNEQHKDFCMLILLLSHADQHVHEWMPQERQLKLKEASRLITEVIVDTTKEMSNVSAQRLKKNIEQVQLFCLPKSEADRKIKENRKTNVVKVREEAFMQLLESSMQHCKNPCGRPYKRCLLRKIFLELDAPKWDPEAKGVCPYEQR